MAAADPASARSEPPGTPRSRRSEAAAPHKPASGNTPRRSDPGPLGAKAAGGTKIPGPLGGKGGSRKHPTAPLKEMPINSPGRVKA